MKKPRRASAGLLEEQAREVLHIGPLTVSVPARRDETGVDFGRIWEAELIFGKAAVRPGLSQPAGEPKKGELRLRETTPEEAAEAKAKVDQDRVCRTDEGEPWKD